MNYMEQVAKMLGVELGERFRVQNLNGDIWEPEYYFGEDGLHGVNFEYICKNTLSEILNGELTIKKKPWKPKNGKPYWRYYFNEDDVSQTTFIQNNGHDILMWKIGNCYKTKEEAEADAPKWKAFFESEEQIDVLGGVTGDTD